MPPGPDRLEGVQTTMQDEVVLLKQELERLQDYQKVCL
jgi:hypothetical protein